MHCTMRRLMIASGLAALPLQFALAQKGVTLKGGVEKTDQRSMKEIYNGQDPLKGGPEVMPTASGPGGSKCTPPNKGWILMARIGNTCYYYAPYPNPRPGFVVKIGDIRRVQGHCGAHPWDNDYAICDEQPRPEKPARDNRRKNDPCSIDDRLTPQQRWEIYHSPAYQSRCVNTGGYNPNNNPNNNPPGNKPPNTYPPNGRLPPGGGLPPTPGPESPPCVIPPPPDVRAALLRGAAELDRISTQVQASELAATNEFFRGLSDSVSNELKFLAQRPGDPARQILDGAIAYLNNDSLENDRQLKSAAAQSIRQMRENPAYFFGSIVPDLVQLAVCEGPGLKKAVDASRIARAQEAQRRIVTINRNAQNFIEETGRPQPSYGTSPNVPKGKPSLQNYFCGNRNCFPVMIAEIDTQLGRDLRRRPYVALEIPPGPGEILPTPAGRAEQVLRRRYGGRVSDPQWGVERALNQIWGVPTEMSIPEIAAEIERGGAGALGGVFIETPGQEWGHVFNVRNEGGRAYFYDQQSGKANRGLAGMLARGRRFWFYRAN